jgi:rhamnose transport system ATP-binding protein
MLKATSICKSFDGVHALRAVSLEVRPGEVHAVIGENGAGKSTLIRIFSGAISPDSGLIEIDGQAAKELDPWTAKALGIATIYQQPALFPDLSVAENIALGVERMGWFARVHWKRRRQRATELLNRIGARIHVHRLAADLSFAEQQLVEIARALGAEAKVLILDEPTTSLSAPEVKILFQVMRSLREQGIALIYISHRLQELFEIANRVTVLRDGASAGTHEMAEVSREMLIRMMVGRELSSIFPKRNVPIGGAALEVRTPGPGKMNLAVRRGEILGIAGLVGSGRTELAETLFGLRPQNDVEILLSGELIRIENPRHAIEVGIALVPEDRRRNGLIMEMPLSANTTLASLKAVSRHGWLDFAKEHKMAASFVNRLAIKTSSVDTIVNQLSGGNQQKVALSRWLATNPSVLILDEPTQGVDVGAKSEIHALLFDLADRGIAIIMISSELEEILGMSDRIAVMRAGAIAGVLNRTEATQENILALALGSAA